MLISCKTTLYKSYFLYYKYFYDNILVIILDLPRGADEKKYRKADL
jgi:hypothetical protein